MKVEFIKESSSCAGLDLTLHQILDTETSRSNYKESVVDKICFSKYILDGQVEYGISILNKDEQYDFDDQWTHSEFVDLIKEMAKLAKLELTEDKKEK